MIEFCVALIRKYGLFFCVGCYFCFFALGCAAFKSDVDALNRCVSDPVCFSQMEKGKDLAESVTSSAVSVTPLFGFAPMISALVGMVASVLLGVRLGKRMR